LWLQKLAERLGWDNVLLNSPVAHIDHDEFAGAIIATTDGRRFQAKRVIVAVPPTLAHTKITYRPQLQTLVLSSYYFI